MQHSKTILLIILAIPPACATQQVSYQRDITPILNNNCNACHLPPHGYGYRASGLQTDSYDALMLGTVYGPIIIAGDSRRSILNKLVEGRAGTMQHNADGETEVLSSEEINVLKNWVDQGALNN